MEDVGGVGMDELLQERLPSDLLQGLSFRAEVRFPSVSELLDSFDGAPLGRIIFALTFHHSTEC